MNDAIPYAEEGSKEPLKRKKLVAEEPDYFLFGHLEHLSEMSGYEGELLNPLLEFQNWFIRYHKAVLLTKWFYNRKSESPYFYVEHLGVFTDLNLLSRRIQNEISSMMSNKFGIDPQFKNYKPSIDFFNEELHIDLPWENYTLQTQYIPIDDTDERRGYEGWKFDLKVDLKVD